MDSSLETLYILKTFVFMLNYFLTAQDFKTCKSHLISLMNCMNTYRNHFENLSSVESM